MKKKILPANFFLNFFLPLLFSKKTDKYQFLKIYAQKIDKLIK